MYDSPEVCWMQEVVVNRKYQITIPKSIRERLSIKAGDRLLIRLKENKIIIEPIRHRKALEKLATIADRLLGGAKKIDAVRLVEESLTEEAGIH